MLDCMLLPMLCALALLSAASASFALLILLREWERDFALDELGGWPSSPAEYESAASPPLVFFWREPGLPLPTVNTVQVLTDLG